MVQDHDGTALAQLRRGVAEPCTLALLEHGERYGFELARALARAGIIAGEGTMYPLLARLREAGWVETAWKPSAEGPPRRYYRLTPAGRRALDRFRDEWPAFRDAVDRMLVTPPPPRGEDHGS
ncbi:MAG: PadR family transcriptional regulator [Actinomycetia bacterium]|nr:PadR family transcriptional regulator [Actinomycetes bacterium]